MNAEQLAALRKPFDKSQVGRLPKGGVMLDYVGHAVVTGRLLDIDPEWSWEPMGIDEHGLPAIDKAGNLWIRLTILGVTRIGVGDGTTAKIAIGDAIRNAAMRFGVALNLWSKEELEDAEHPQEDARQPVQAPPAPVQQAPADQPGIRAFYALKALHPQWEDSRIIAEADDVIKEVLHKERHALTADEWTALAEQWEKEKASAA